jgi:hypothetical protein
MAGNTSEKTTLRGFLDRIESVKRQIKCDWHGFVPN